MTHPLLYTAAGLGRPQDKRRESRLRQHRLRCSVGQIVDISTTGVRLFTPYELGEQLDLELIATDDARLKLQARVVWRRKLGRRKHVSGLAFVGMTDEKLSDLAQMLWLAARQVHEPAPPKPSRLKGWLIGFGLLLLAMHVGLRLLHTEGVADGWLSRFDPRVLHGVETFSFLVGYALLLGGLCLAMIDGSRRRRRPRPASVAVDPPPVLTAPRRVKGDAVLNSILEGSLDAVMVLTAVRNTSGSLVDFHCRMMNTAAEHMLGRSEQMLIGRSCFQNVPLLTRLDLFDTLASVRDSGLPAHLERYCSMTRRWYEVSSAKCEDGVTVHLRDITDKRANAEKLKHDALHDGLTGLANRKAFEERLSQVLHRAQHHEGYQFAVLFLDFDRFKIINDSLGHEVGDDLLINIADKLRRALGISPYEPDMYCPHLPARLGGDEFVILLDRIRGREDVLKLADQLLEEFLRPHVLGPHEVVSTASIGIVLSNAQYRQADEVLRDADTAMYRAKAAGKARYALFDDSMHEEAMRRLTLERQLREAVESEQFSLVYEPIVSLADGHIIAFEALIRWEHPQLGAVSPSEFIPIAEELGLIGRVGEWTLRTACAQLAKWCAKRPHAKDLVVSINLSRQQVLDPGLVDMVRNVMRANRMSPRQLQIEITENTVMTDVKQMTRVLGQLRELGVTLAMDDFGTGQSSLHSLHMFPIDVLKIDRSFIDTRDKDARWWAAIIHATVELAHNLNMSVVAEGIESPEQLALLQGLSCDAGQGWIFAHAAEGDEAGRHLDQRRLLEMPRPTAA